MSRFKILYFLCGLFIALSSCEDVVDVDLETAAERLVVDANINWYATTSGENQVIYLSTTAPYFDEEIPAATNAEVRITDSENNEYLFLETQAGTYVCTNFSAVIGRAYQLEIQWKNQTYKATEILMPTPEFASVTQDNEGGIMGDDIEIRYEFPDDANQENFYLVKTTSSLLAFPEFDVINDEFTNGNNSFGLFLHDDLTAGIGLRFELQGISERYHNYMFRLLQNTQGNAGPFETASSTVRGNVVNTSNSSQYALGYFRLGEVKVLEYTVQ